MFNLDKFVLKSLHTMNIRSITWTLSFVLKHLQLCLFNLDQLRFEKVLWNIMVILDKRSWLTNYSPVCRTKRMSPFWFILCVDTLRFLHEFLVREDFFGSLHIISLIISNASHKLGLFFFILSIFKLRTFPWYRYENILHLGFWST